MLVFVVLGVAGLALALLSLVAGDLLELGGVSGTSLGAGLVLFGATGAVVVANGLPVAVAYPASIVVGGLVVLGVHLVLKRLKAGDDSGPVDRAGVQGVVTSVVAPGHGEVSLDGELEARLAWSDEPIDQGTRVVVVEEAGGRVKVEPAPR